MNLQVIFVATVGLDLLIDAWVFDVMDLIELRVPELLLRGPRFDEQLLLVAKSKNLVLWEAEILPDLLLIFRFKAILPPLLFSS